LPPQGEGERPLAQVGISLNKRTYRFECGEDEVERLEALANYLKTKLDALMLQHGSVGDERLVIMAALTLADELFDARADIDNLLEGSADEQTEQLRATLGTSTSTGTGAGKTGTAAVVGGAVKPGG